MFRLRTAAIRCVYFNIGNVRYEHDWYDHECTGSRNTYVKLDKIGTACKLIRSRQSEFAA